ncbi:hypothetical protein C7N83_11975 [Neisseria iguanae]|uniref:Uncharacterized protein n=1 Tax=Neisseria iguanae TaxID=90242 RepID=A0A2P7TXV5_9NEIS|nr:hypothetical protein C7N83_11975 [Neisseria iguanae]
MRVLGWGDTCYTGGIYIFACRFYGGSSPGCFDGKKGAFYKHWQKTANALLFAFVNPFAG